MDFDFSEIIRPTPKEEEKAVKQVAKASIEEIKRLKGKKERQTVEEERATKALKEKTELTFALDLAHAKMDLSQYNQAIDKMMAEAEAIEVINDVSSQKAVELAANAKKLFNRIEKQRKEIVTQPNQFIKAVNAFAKGFQNKLSQIENDLKTKISLYQNKIELERREQEKKAKEAAEKLQEEINEEAKEKGIEAPVVPIPIVPETKIITRTEEGASASQRKTWKFKVVDISKVPKAYICISEVKVRQAIRMGIRQIEGLEIFEEITTVLRT